MLIYRGNKRLQKIRSLEKVKKYINNNNKRPSSENQDKEIKTLGTWLSNQQNNYKTKCQI